MSAAAISATAKLRFVISVILIINYWFAPFNPRTIPQVGMSDKLVNNYFVARSLYFLISKIIRIFVIYFFAVMIVKANCKINIGLRVVRKRDDGYHELQSVMLPVRGLYDVVSIERSEGCDVSLSQSGIVVDCPAERNLAVRAAQLMQQRYGLGGVAIALDKRVPFGAGLGGGSSDATAVIVAMNDMFDLALSREELAALASELGSDTPFFVYNTPQYCTGRGEIMRPIELDLRGLWLVVVKPEEGVSTAEAYGGVKPVVPHDELPELIARDIHEWQGSVINDFESHIFERHPRIASLKAELLAHGAIYASMSGSGSALFGLFDRRPNLCFAADCFVHIEQM